jgi:hypothetical protein
MDNKLLVTTTGTRRMHLRGCENLFYVYDNIRTLAKIGYALIKLIFASLSSISRDDAYFHNMLAKTEQMFVLIANEFYHGQCYQQSD